MLNQALATIIQNKHKIMLILYNNLVLPLCLYCWLILARENTLWDREVKPYPSMTLVEID